MIDFEPSFITKVVVRSSHVAIVFPKQVMYGTPPEDEPPSCPFVHCELLIQGGKVSAELLELPISADNIHVDYKDGSRACFLPIGFSAEGPVRVYAEIDSNLVLLADGGSIALVVISGPDTVPVESA